MQVSVGRTSRSWLNKQGMGREVDVALDGLVRGGVGDGEDSV